MLEDNQWTGVWTCRSSGLPVTVRIIGARFAPGDTVGVRPAGRPIGMFRVAGRDPA